MGTEKKVFEVLHLIGDRAITVYVIAESISDAEKKVLARVATELDKSNVVIQQISLSEVEIIV